MPPTAPTPRPPLVEKVLDGLKEPVLVLTGDGAAPPPPPHGSVVLAVSDVVALRAAVADLPDLGRARMVAVVLGEAEVPVPLRVHPRWPALQDLDARLEDGGAVTVARFTSRVDVAEVLTALAHPEGPPGHGGLIVARAYDPDDTVPPDVVIGAVEAAESPVLGRAPLVVADPGPEPLDETLFHPAGLRRDWERGILDLDPAWRATPGLVARLRDAQGVRVPPGADERLVAALAMSGVPLVAPGEEAVLDDPAAREEHARRQSREATLRHSVASWRRGLAERAGVRVAR